MIKYTANLDILDSLNLDGFFIGWINPPSNAVLKKILKSSYKVVLAYEDDKLIGFINAISDGVLSAYIPLLEVTPKYQRRNIGKELFTQMKDKLKHLYMVDLSCDDGLIPYYENLGMTKSQGVCSRNYDRSSGS